MSVCVSVCVSATAVSRQPLVRSNETCQEYCRGPEDVPFQGLILIGQAVPKLRPFICKPITGHGAMTSRMTSQWFLFFYMLS